MSPSEQEKMVKMFRVVDVQKKYKEMYGNDWKQVYDEDKENGCLMKCE